MLTQQNDAFPPGPLPIAADQPLPPLGTHLNVLMVWPRFPPSFWGFEGVLDMLPEAAMTPPLGLITVAALCPASWNLRLIDHCFEESPTRLLAGRSRHGQRHARPARRRPRHPRRATRVSAGAPLSAAPGPRSEPDAVLRDADHVLVGEAEEAFADIAAALEQGTAKRLYPIVDKPDMTRSPMPRFDLLRLRQVHLHARPVLPRLPVPVRVLRHHHHLRPQAPRQDSRADHLRARPAPRRSAGAMKSSSSTTTSSATAQAPSPSRASSPAWQTVNNRPFSFYTEASIDLADRARAPRRHGRGQLHVRLHRHRNPLLRALKESRKFQNLRNDNVHQVRIIQEAGLWVLAGFIVGFDSDNATSSSASSNSSSAPASPGPWPASSRPLPPPPSTTA